MTAFAHTFSILTVLSASAILTSGCQQKTPSADTTPSPSPLTPISQATFAGSESCAACHLAEHEKWMGSYHQEAQQAANDQTVLGDFNDKQFVHYGVTSRFHIVEGEYRITTQDGEGRQTDFPVDFVIGVYPLQQYVTRMTNGHYQVFQLCWDTRPQEDGGQRWFHLYPNEAIPPEDMLHWTGPNFNWNYMCADCHATDLDRNFDVKTHSFDTKWSEF
jgi:cytochrome c553